ncbi:MAG: alanyl-tRNA editing protein [Actinobacteria bacterium]|nr:alanyl-tRNA editing protein [Actinomycetota bacterium]
MATHELFYFDAYVRDFEARVEAVRPDGVVLDQSAFYPRGGGQPSDRGELSAGSSAWPVTSVVRRAGEIVHTVEGAPPDVGAVVHGALDWDYRYRLMRLHTALHALSQVVWRGWGADVTGSNIYDTADRARMDFALEHTRINDIRDAIESHLNAELAAAHDVRVYDLPRAEALQMPDLIRTHINLVPEHVARIRITEIVGLDRQADGGTHVANTREVGRIAIVNAENKGRLNRRLEIAFAP